MTLCLQIIARGADKRIFPISFARNPSPNSVCAPPYAGLVDALMSDPQAQKLLIKRLCSSMGRMPSTVPSEDIEFYHKLWTAMVPVADELRLDQFFQGEFSEREDQDEIVKGYPPTQDEDGYDGTSAAPEPEKEKRKKNRLVVDNNPNDNNSCLCMHEDTMSLLDIFSGDNVLVRSKRKKETVLYCTSDGASCDVGEVRVNGVIRKNLGVKLGDVVGIHKVDNLPYGTKVSVLPFADSIEGITGNLFEVWLKPYFSQAYRPVKVDDTFIVRGNMRAIEFKVKAIEVMDKDKGVQAAPYCIVSPDTVFFCEGSPVKREEGFIDEMDNIGFIGVETSSDDDDDSSEVPPEVPPEVSSDDIDDLLSDYSEAEDAFRECWYDDPVADKALRQTYRAAIRCGPFPNPGNSSLPGLASFTSALNRMRDEIREEEDDIEAAEAQEAADEAKDDAAFVQESLVEMFHDAAAEFRDAFDIDNQRGLGCKRPLTLRLHEEVEALRQVKLRVEQAESSGMQPDVDDIQDVLDGVDDVLDSRDRIERKLSGAIGLLFSTLYFLKQHVPDGQMKDRIYGGIEAERSWREDFEYGDSEVCWADHDDGEQSFSDFVDHLQALEGKLRAFLDELSASDPELHSKRIAFESEETALAEIRCEQRDTRTIINPQAFSLLCQEILQDFSSFVHFSDEALDALQAAAESRVIEGFQKANLVAIHAGRTYVTPRDLHLVNALDTWAC